MKLGIRSLATLRPHEKTIPEHVQKIVAQLESDGVQKDPIIVDGETGTVLDGMHRVAAFSSLSFEKAVCCLVDYSSASVGLGRWARVYDNVESDVTGMLREMGFDRASRVKDALEKLEIKSVGLAAFTGGSAYLAGREMGLEGAFDVVDNLDSTAEKRSWRRKFVPEDETDFSLEREGELVTLVQRIQKDDVTRAAGTGRMFPCKTSMHFIEPRPVGVSFPTSDLNSASDEVLLRRLEDASPIDLPAGSVYEGRRYKERLVVINPA